MRSDVTRWARECLACQRAKVTKHTVPPIGEFTVPNKRFDHVNIDLVTLPPSNGFRYLLTIVDRFTRWPVAVPLADVSAQSVLDGFSYGWIQTFGVPSTISSDRGTQFTSEIFRQFTSTWGINTIQTTPYHPEANGLVERFHRRLKEALLALGADEPETWFWRLPCVMLAIRTTLKPDVGASPADLVFGEGLAVPGELLPSNPATESQLIRQRVAALADLRLEVSRLQPTQTSAHRRPLIHLPEALDTCSHVFVRRGASTSHQTLATPYVGPFKVITRSAVNFKVSVPGRGDETVSISRVKPAYSSIEDADEAIPPPRVPLGRPPRRRPPRPPPTPRQRSESPPIRRHVPRGRARPLPSDDEDPLQPQLDDELFQHPPDYEVPTDDAPVWNPPDWFDPEAVVDWGAGPEVADHLPPPLPPPPPPAESDDIPEPETRAPAAPEPHLPPPPPPPRPWRISEWRTRTRRPGNPNWKKGGSGVGRRNNRPRPDVTAIFSHLGIPSNLSTSSPTHLCSMECDGINSSP